MSESDGARLGTIQADGEQYAIRLERVYPASPEALWSALTEPGELRGWIGELSGSVAPGSTFELRLTDDPPEVVRCRVRVFEPPRVLEVDWEPSGEAPSSLRFELGPADDGTRFVLSHRALTQAVAKEYGAGWHTYTEQLAASLTSGNGRGAQWDARYTELLRAYEAQVPAAGHPSG